MYTASARTGWLPLRSGILEIADQFVLLRVEGDHGLPASAERGRGGVDVLELRVAVGVRRTFARLLQCVQAIAESVQELPDRHAPYTGGPAGAGNTIEVRPLCRLRQTRADRQSTMVHGQFHTVDQFTPISPVSHRDL